MGVQIIYPEPTCKKQTQNGMIMNMITEGSVSEKRMIRLIDNKDLETETERSPLQNGMITEGSQTTTIDTIILNNSREKNPCPHAQIIDFYHDVLPELPKVRIWDGQRKRFLAARWKKAIVSPSTGLKSNTLEFWQAFFNYIRKSDFLMGKKTEFKANLGWIVKKENFYKIVEGNYHK